MPVRLRLAYHPDRLEAQNPRLIEDLLDIAYSGEQEAVDAMIMMLADLHQVGHSSRFVKKLQGLPLWELKTRSRGGSKGGARIYFSFIHKQALLFNAEVKPTDTLSVSKVTEAVTILHAYVQGVPVIKEAP